jgi:hypothetical protein
MDAPGLIYMVRRQRSVGCAQVSWSEGPSWRGRRVDLVCVCLCRVCCACARVSYACVSVSCLCPVRVRGTETRGRAGGHPRE